LGTIDQQAPPYNGPANAVKVTNKDFKGTTQVKRLIALQAAFMASALWHIYLYWLLAGGFGWRWGAFFCVQGPLMVLERKAQQAAKGAGLQLPAWLAVILTNTLLIQLADPLLITPLVEAGVVDKIIAQCSEHLRNVITAGLSAHGSVL
jgi:hypothetical protein